MYITEDAGEIYVDLSADKRIKLNAEAANKIHKLTKSADGTLSEVSLNYDDLLAIHQGFTDDISAINTNLAKKMDIVNPTGTGNLMVTGPATKLNIGSGNSLGTGKTYAIGDNITAMGNYSFGVGQNILADSAHVYAFGKDITSEGTYSFTTGLGTQTEGDYQVVHGKYNTPDGTSLVIIGNGTNDSNRSNAYVLDSTGSGKFAGDVYVSNGAKKLATEDAVAAAKTSLETKITANTTLINGLKYAGSTTVGGAANSANKVNITRPAGFVDAAAAVANGTEQIFFYGSDGITNGAPVNYVIINVKKGDNGRTIADCYSLQTGAHYINGCMNSGNNASGSDYNVWTGWKLQPKFDDNGHLVPSTTDAYNIGSTSLEWNNIYANNFHGNLNGTIGGFTVAANVPSDAKFTDTNTTKVIAGNGLFGGGRANSSDGVELGILQGAGIVVTDDGVKTALTSESVMTYVATTAYTPTPTTVQPVQLDANGKLAVVMPDMTAAAATAAGSKGLVPAPGAGKQYAFLRGDGTWATPTDTTYSIATASTAGLVKPISVITKPTINSASTTSGKYYPVQMSSDGNMFVNVPWENTTYFAMTASEATTGTATTARTITAKVLNDKIDAKISGLTSNTGTVTSVVAGTGLTGGTITTSGTIALATSGATAGTYGAASSPSHGGTFAIPSITVDAYGRVTKATTVNVTLPSDSNTDTKVTQTVRTTNGSFPLLLRGTSAGTTTTTTTTSFATAITANPSTGALTATSVYGAVWNDYAEYRQSDITESGRVICENGDDTLSLATERLQPGASVISDTFGFAIGETETAKTPIAVSGRVLVYPYEDRNSYKPGDAVCAAPNGTVSKMTREEVREYPERIVGTVSAIPEYETWGEGNVPVNGRIWIKVK